MTDLVVYGASDDLIETSGLLCEELNPPYGKPAILTVMVDNSAHVSLLIEYDDEGEWRIQPAREIVWGDSRPRSR